MKQRIISLFCLVLAAVLLAPAALAGWQPPEEASAPEAAAVYLAELNTGTVLYERNADEPRAIASLTKMMTCLLLAESGADLDEVFLVPQELAEEFWHIRAEDGAYINLQVGEETNLRDLMYCTMLPSTNDTASTIAWRLAGSIEAFVEQMNRRAAQLGCENTRYSCPHGLYDAGNWSTARDLARIAAACMDNERMREVCTSYEWWLPLNNVQTVVRTPGAPEGMYLRIGSSIQMQTPDSPLYRPWARGVKTGFTDAAGRCIVTTAETDTGRYLLVLLGEPNRKAEDGIQLLHHDAAALLDWAVERFEVGQALTGEKALAQIPVRWCEETALLDAYPAGSITALLCADTPAELTVELTCEELQAPVAAGTQVGTVTVQRAGEVLGTLPLEVRQELTRSDELYYRELLAPYRTHILAGLAAVCLVLVLAVFALVRRARRRTPARRR